MELAEFQIVEQCRDGNWSNFGQLYDQYLPKIYQYLYYRTHHIQVAQDLTSEVFFKLIKNIESYKAGNSGFGPWFYRIARNTLTDYIRKQKSTVDIESIFDLASDENIANSADNKLNLDLVKKQLSNLSVLQQEILVLRVWDGLSHREIGEILDISEDSSKVNYSRAINTLKETIQA